jgi:transcription antitermination factor NusG
MGFPEEKVRKEAADLLAQLQEAREKPQFVLLDKEERRLMKASVALLGKFRPVGPHDKKMTETINAIMHHMSALIEKSERVFVPAKESKRDFKPGDKIRVNLHRGKIEDAVVRAVVHDDDGIKLQVDVVGLDLTALIDTRQVVEWRLAGATRELP